MFIFDNRTGNITPKGNHLVIFELFPSLLQNSFQQYSRFKNPSAFQYQNLHSTSATTNPQTLPN